MPQSTDAICGITTVGIAIPLVFTWFGSLITVNEQHPKLGALVLFTELTTAVLLICVLIVVAELFPALRQKRVTCAECGRGVQDI